METAIRMISEYRRAEQAVACALVRFPEHCRVVSCTSREGTVLLAPVVKGHGLSDHLCFIKPTVSPDSEKSKNRRT